MDLNSIERLQEYSDLPTEKMLTAAPTASHHHGKDGSGSGNDNGSRRAGSLKSLWSSLCSLFYSDGDIEDDQLSESNCTDVSMDTSSHPLMHSSGSTQGPVASSPVDDVVLGQPSSGSEGAAWPSEGRVEFRNITLQYNSNANPVLR